jgi:hypothetical protein
MEKSVKEDKRHTSNAKNYNLMYFINVMLRYGQSSSMQCKMRSVYENVVIDKKVEGYRI